jgi:plastocyanin
VKSTRRDGEPQTHAPAPRASCARHLHIHSVFCAFIVPARRDVLHSIESMFSLSAANAVKGETMKRILLVLPIFMLLASILFFGSDADASPDAKLTLNAGQTGVINRNGCKLQVTKETNSQVRVKCNAVASTARLRAPEGTAAQITLSAGQIAKIFANQCALDIIKNKPKRVKVKCNAIASPTPTDTADAFVTVGPGGSFSYSGDVNIHVGETVEWTWGSSNHTVTSGNGTPDNLFCSPNDTNCANPNASATGAKYRHTFNNAGTFKYYCGIHGAFMSATVNVSP